MTEVLLAAIVVLLALIAAFLFLVTIKVAGTSQDNLLRFGVYIVLALLIGFGLVQILDWINRSLELW